MHQDVFYKFPGPPDPELKIVRRVLAVRVNGQRNPAQPIRVKPDTTEVLIGTFSAGGGENIEIDHYDVDAGRRKTPVSTVRFTVPSPPVPAAPEEGTFRVDQVLDAGEQAEEEAATEGQEGPSEGSSGEDGQEADQTTDEASDPPGASADEGTAVVPSPSPESSPDVTRGSKARVRP